MSKIYGFPLNSICHDYTDWQFNVPNIETIYEIENFDTNIKNIHYITKDLEFINIPFNNNKVNITNEIIYNCYNTNDCYAYFIITLDNEPYDCKNNTPYLYSNDKIDISNKYIHKYNLKNTKLC